MSTGGGADVAALCVTARARVMLATVVAIAYCLECNLSTYICMIAVLQHDR